MTDDDTRRAESRKRLDRQGVRFDEYDGEDDDGQWYFVHTNVIGCVPTQGRTPEEAMDRAIRLASAALVKGNGLRGDK